MQTKQLSYPLPNLCPPRSFVNWRRRLSSYCQGRNLMSRALFKHHPLTAIRISLTVHSWLQIRRETHPWGFGGWIWVLFKSLFMVNYNLNKCRKENPRHRFVQCTMMIHRWWWVMVSRWWWNRKGGMLSKGVGGSLISDHKCWEKYHTRAIFKHRAAMAK